jgi:hypothetical protein
VPYRIAEVAARGASPLAATEAARTCGQAVSVTHMAAHARGAAHDRAVRENADALDRDLAVIEIRSSDERHGVVICYGDGRVGGHEQMEVL